MMKMTRLAFLNCMGSFAYPIRCDAFACICGELSSNVPRHRCVCKILLVSDMLGVGLGEVVGVAGGGGGIFFNDQGR